MKRRTYIVTVTQPDRMTDADMKEMLLSDIGFTSGSCHPEDCTHDFVHYREYTAVSLLSPETVLELADALRKPEVPELIPASAEQCARMTVLLKEMRKNLKGVKD